MGLCPFHNEKSPVLHGPRGAPVLQVLLLRRRRRCDQVRDGEGRAQLLRGPQVARPSATASPCPSAPTTPTRIPNCAAPCWPCTNWPRRHFRANLNSQAGEAARAYIAKRGLAPETVEHFGLGYSDRSGRALVRLFEQHGFPVAQMEQSGPGRQAAGRQPLRPLSQPADVSDPQRVGQDHRVRRTRAGRRRRAQVPEFARNADLQEEPRALQPAPRKGGRCAKTTG